MGRVARHRGGGWPIPRGILGRCLSCALMITSRATPACEPARPLTHFANSARPQEWPQPPCPGFRHRGVGQPWCLSRLRNPAPTGGQDAGGVPMEETVLDPLLASKEKGESMGWGPGERRSPPASPGHPL